MKTKIIIALLAIPMLLFSQTTVNLSSMTSDISLGQDCSNSQTPEEFISPGDANLNLHTIHLRNAHLKVNGNINGGGAIVGCGQSSICKTGSIQNFPYIEQNLLVNCAVLETDSFEFINDIPKNLEYSLYNLMGQEIYKGNTNMLYFPLNKIIIIKVTGYESKKIFIK